MKSIPFLFAALITIFAETGEAVTYYVSPAGSNSNSGTSISSPWGSIDKVNSMNFAAGDRVLFQGGATFQGNLYFDANDTGINTNRISVGSYGTGRATISSGVGDAIYLYNTAGFNISDLTLQGAGPGVNAGRGLIAYTDLAGRRSGFLLQNLEVKGYDGVVSGTSFSEGDGIYFLSWRADTQMSGFEDVTVSNCTSHDNGNSGMSTWSHTLYGNLNFLVSDCTFYNNTGKAGIANPTGSGVVFGRMQDARIERCLAYSNGAANTNSAGPVGIWAYDSTGIIIQFCESYNNRTNGGDGGGFDLDGGVTESVIQYCYSHGNYGAGYLLACYSGAPTLSGNIIRYNISQNDGRKGGYGGIMLWGASGTDKVENTLIYNNTVYTGTETPVFSGTPACLRFLGSNFAGIKLWNNLFITNSGHRLATADTALSTSAARLQGNNYWATGAFSLKWGGSTHSTFNAWVTAASTQERIASILVGLNLNPLVAAAGTGGTIGNPALLTTNLSAYKLTSGSPMIGAGRDLQAEFSVDPGVRDYYTSVLPRGSGFDIGAHEFQGSGPSTGTVRATGGEIVLGNDVTAYDSNQDGEGGLPTSSAVSSDGMVHRIEGNAWKKFPSSFSVQTNTHLEFTVNAPDAGEVLAITLDNDANPTTGRRGFRFGGSTVDSTAHDTWSWKIAPTYEAASDQATYVIPVGTYFTGPISFIGFVGDDDADASTLAYFRDVKIYNATSPGQGQSVTTTADAYTRNGTYAATNFGESANLVVKSTGTSGLTRRSYLKFPVASLAGSASCVLLLPIDSLGTEGTSNFNLELRQVADDTWTEAGITWSNQPSSGALISAFTVFPGDVGNYISIDVGAFVAQQAAGDGVASFALMQPGTTGRTVNLSSREGSMPARLEGAP